MFRALTERSPICLLAHEGDQAGPQLVRERREPFCAVGEVGRAQVT